jgi:U4/U6 small nuclear ribonucleoprotein PRP3
MAVKRAFHSFMFQTAANSTMARKILEAKGVAHYWDLAVGHYEMKVPSHNGGEEEGAALRFRLGD